ACRRRQSRLLAKSSSAPAGVRPRRERAPTVPVLAALGDRRGPQVTVAAQALPRAMGRYSVRFWLQVAFWAAIAFILLILTGVQFGPAATISILSVTITKATPITLGALAGISSERTGVVNIGIEGLMLTSAFIGFMTGVYTHNLGLAPVAAVLSSRLLPPLPA